MKFTRFSSLIAVAALACASIAARAWDHVKQAGTAIAVGMRAFALHVVDVLAPVAGADRAPSVRFVQAKAFVARITRREGLQLTSGWRMCPSI